MTTRTSQRVVVIGAGLGGTSAAISLAADGYDVEIVEKNQHVGGKLNQMQKDGFSFDLGPSILTLPAVFEKLFLVHGRRMADYISIRQLSPHWGNFFEDGTRIDLYADPGETGARNDALSDGDVEDLKNFLNYSRSLYDFTTAGYFEKGLDTAWQMIRFYGPITSLRKFDLLSTVDKGVKRRVRNPYLRDILNFFCKYVGSSPYHAPGVLNLLPYVQFEFGLWYVDGGLFELARGLQRLVADVGVSFRNGTEVVGITTEKGRACGVVLAGGERIEADIVVCNMEVVPAYNKLLGEDAGFLRKLSKFEPACSGLVIHLGLDREYPHLAHHNFFYTQDPKKHFDEVFRRYVLPEDPTLYVVAPARTDRTQAPEGCENLKILPHIPYLQDEAFTAEQYAQLKERVLDKLERMGIENLRRYIVVEDLWTPEDIQRLYYSNRGAIYGVVSDKKRNQGFKAPKRSARYKGLYFVGGSVNPGGGMPMAVLSGQQVRNMIVSDSR